MRRWKVVIIDMETGECSPPARYFRRFAAQREADRKNAQLTSSPRRYTRLLRADVIDSRFERRVLRQRRLGDVHCRL